MVMKVTVIRTYLNFLESGKFSSVQHKIDKLTESLERLESENNGISKLKYQAIQSENESLIRSIEDELNR